MKHQTAWLSFDGVEMKLFGFEITKRATLENPTTLLNPAKWLVDWAGGGVSKAGVQVTPANAMKYPALYAAVSLISQTVAQLPFIVYRRTADGKEVFADHPVHRLLHDSPNQEMTAVVYRETATLHTALWGNHYSFISRDNAGRPAELIPLAPDRTTAERVAGVLQYRTTINGATVIIDPVNILHIPALGFDGINGISPIRLARESIGLGLATEQFGSSFFGQGSKPSGVLEHPGKLSPEAQLTLRNSWERMNSGLENAQKTAILEEGMTFRPLTIPPEDAQFLQTRKFQVQEIARWYRVPPHMIGDLERSTFNNIEHQSIDFVVHTIMPWLVRWEQEVNRKLFTESERRTLFVKHKVMGLLRGDTKTRTQAYAVGRVNGWLSANEIREFEDMNKIEGGDIYLQPLNMTAAAGENLEPDGGTGQEPAANEDNAFDLWFKEDFRKLVRREVDALKRIIRKKPIAGIVFNNFYKEFEAVIALQLNVSMTSSCRAIDLKGMAARYAEQSLQDIFSVPFMEIEDRVLNKWLESKADYWAEQLKETENEQN